MTKEKKIVSCALCLKETEEEEALKVREHFLCSECEGKIVQSKAEDLLYPIYVEKIKEFWLNKQ